MKKTLLTMSLFGLLAGSASATLIDDFNGGNQNVSDPQGGICPSNNNATQSYANAIGGFRTLSAQRTSGGACASADVNQSTSGAYSWQLGNTTDGLFQIIWDGNGGGLGGLTIGVFSFNARQDADSPPNEASNVVFRLYSDAAGTNLIGTTTVASIVSQVSSNYGVSVIGGPVTGVNRIVMELDGGLERDGSIDLLNAEVPEPSTMALAGAALVALAALRRRS